MALNVKILRALLWRGYFPELLPPPFTSARFAREVVRNRDHLPAGFTNGKLAAALGRFDQARPGDLRRVFGEALFEMNFEDYPTLLGERRALMANKIRAFYESL